jgi:hypothetical protein
VAVDAPTSYAATPRRPGMDIAEPPEEPDPECPTCATGAAYSLIVEVPMGVQFPDDDDHAAERRTRRSVNCCVDCGTLYDPVVNDRDTG